VADVEKVGDLVVGRVALAGRGYDNDAASGIARDNLFYAVKGSP
jgi:hypothetical protein